MIPINKKPGTGGPMPKPKTPGSPIPGGKVGPGRPKTGGPMPKPGVVSKPTGAGQTVGKDVGKKTLPAANKQNQINKDMLAKAYAKRNNK